MRQFWFKLAAAAVGLAVAVYAAVSYVGVDSQTRVFPGGVRISLVALTHGATNVFFPGGPLDKLWYRLFPGKRVSIAKFRYPYTLVSPISIPYDNFSGSNFFEPNRQTIVWLRYRAAQNIVPWLSPELSLGKYLRPVIVNEEGQEWEVRPGPNGYFLGPGRGLDMYSGWCFPTFPHREKRLRFKLYSPSVSNQWNLLAEFKISNPTVGDYPVWKPMTLPSTVTNGDLRVSLVKLVSGFRIDNLPPKGPFTRATFMVEHNGRQTADWTPHWMDATDATGNVGSFLLARPGLTNGLVVYEARFGSLSPSEVWRLKMEFKNEKASPGGTLHARAFEFLARPSRE